MPSQARVWYCRHVAVMPITAPFAAITLIAVNAPENVTVPVRVSEFAFPVEALTPWAWASCRAAIAFALDGAYVQQH